MRIFRHVHAVLLRSVLLWCLLCCCYRSVYRARARARSRFIFFSISLHFIWFIWCVLNSHRDLYDPLRLDYISSEWPCFSCFVPLVFRPCLWQRWNAHSPIYYCVHALKKKNSSHFNVRRMLHKFPILSILCVCNFFLAYAGFFCESKIQFGMVLEEKKKNANWFEVDSHNDGMIFLSKAKWFN